jgi:hypothetical protein
MMTARTLVSFPFNEGPIVVYQSKQSVEAEARRLQEVEAGLVSERFPKVKLIRVEVRFHDATGAQVQRRIRELPPDAYAIFEMKCPLDSTPLDFKPIVTRMIHDREKKKSGEMRCAGSQTDTQHSAAYQIEIEYRTKR